MNNVIDDLIVHKDTRLSSIVVDNHLWLNSINDVINYCENNPNAHSGQFIGTHTNFNEKIYILLPLDILFSDGNKYIPICINDIAEQGALESWGTYQVVSRITGISGGLLINLQNINATHYKLNLNGTYITTDYQSLSEVFITAPIIFSNNNSIFVDLYDDSNGEMELITTMRFISSISTNNVASGILTPLLD